MASYYYLISSLPDLRTDGEMPFSYEEFLGMCQSNVSESKYECLKNLTLSSEEGPIMKEWAGYFDCSDDEIMQMLMPYFRDLDF